MNSLFSITKLGGYIILFSVFQGIVQFLLSSSSFFSVMLCGLTEFSTGLNALKDTALPFSLKFPLTMGFSSFGGLCVLAQTSCVLSGTDLPLFPYLIGRIVCTSLPQDLLFYSSSSSNSSSKSSISRFSSGSSSVCFGIGLFN